MRISLRSVGTLFICLALALFFVSTGWADEHASATKRVVAKVLPNVSVGGAAPTVPEIQTGRFVIFVPYRVDANQQNVFIQILATNLYKADDPASEFYIPVADDRQVSVVPANGIEVGDGNNHLPLEDDLSGELGEFEGFMTTMGEFESSQRGHFSQDVIVDVHYNQRDPELPIGDYSGFVQMRVWLNP